MANVNSTGVAIAPKKNVKVALINNLVESADVKERFNKMLGNRAGAFLSSLLTLCNSTPALQRCEPATVLSAAATAASLNLSINPSLGQAYIIPYGSTASWQIGYKGIIQLAMRSGQMKSIVVTEVYEGEINQWNRFTETFTPGERKSNKIVGYYAAFELINGFKKCIYMKEEDVIAHGKRFSKTFNNGPWKTDTVAMCKKTVLKTLLTTFAPLSIDMQSGFESEEDDTITGSQEQKVDTFDVAVEEVKPVEVAEAKKEEVPFNDEPGAPTKEEQKEILAMMEK